MTKLTVSLFSLTLGVAINLPSMVLADSAGLARAAENSAHRLERLVILKKIPDTFLTALQSMSVTAQLASDGTVQGYQSVSQEFAGADGKARTVTITMDASGKALGQVVAGETSTGIAPAFPDKDSVTLMETALHCIEGEIIGDSDLCAKDTKLVPLAAELQSIRLRADVNGSGVITGATALAVGKTAGMKAQIHLSAAALLNNGAPIEWSTSRTAVSYADIKTNIFDVKCMICHSNPASPAGQKVPLSPYALLMNSDRDLVLPGNVEESGLWIAVQSTNPKRMPPAPLTALTDDDLTQIRQWITTGASEN